MLRLTVAGFAVAVILLGGSPSPIPGGRPFPSAEAAVQALVGAAKNGDVAGLMDILGPAAEDFISTSPAAGRRICRDFAMQAAEEISLVSVAGRQNKVTLLTGHNKRPLPIPIVEVRGKWYFDTARVTPRQSLISKDKTPVPGGRSSATLTKPLP